MQIYSLNDAPIQGANTVFRQSRLSQAMGVFIGVIMTGVGIFFTFRGAGCFALIFAGGGAVLTFFLARRWLRSLGTEHWLLRCDPRRLLIKVAPMLTATPSDADCVIEVPNEEVEWIRVYRLTTVSMNMRDSSDTGKSVDTRSYLDIKLRSADLETLRSALRAAAAPRKWHGFNLPPDILVGLTQEGVLRMRWHGGVGSITPSLKDAIAILGKRLKVQADLEETEDLTVMPGDKQRQDRRIVELAEQGRMIDAVKLVRKYYGCSLADAQKVVEQLQLSHKAAATSHSPPAQ